ncbi:hypothetical protein [Parasphingorhabdus halotolerans]|uniref:ElaB/YqjD/DUF883 family membrane-anchored ribosome-binding protein n=1 Tax=Parasphingorhabdus halotolerans TaxID=2725558 RepID=A0A6H2DPB0_9SPHN|nr:hypothetical protein [Parasphingorhabdus halotolerans]QJB70499.1 hypothetical protein HF685_15555 [Parasphingorhabdus halotolerans]
MNKETTIAHPQHDHDYGSQIAVIRSDLERLQGDFTKLGHEVAEDAGERMKHFSEFASDQLKEKGAVLREAGERGKQAAVAEVKRHPIASIVGAASAGLALGALALFTQNGAKR